MGYFDALKTPPPPTPTPTNNVTPIRDNGDLHPYARAIRDAWLGRLDNLNQPWTKGAAWDQNCFVTARKLTELANSGWSGYGLDTAHADYTAHAPHDHAWDQREKCWAQGVERAGATSLPAPDPGTPVPDVTVLLADLDPDLGPPLNPIIDWHHLFESEDEDEDWIVEPLLPARRMVALYSAPKAGKSLLMLEIAVGVARGSDVIGSRIDRPRRVLYVDFENDPRGDVRSRLAAMDLGPGDLTNLCYLTFPSLAKFDTAQGALDLLRHVKGYDCEVVVIDTVSRSVGGEENANDTWLAFYRHTGLALKQNGVACIRLDHSGKDREKGMRGGSAKYGDVDAVWRLSLLNDSTVQLECTDNRMPVPVKMLTLERQDFPLAHKVVGVSWQVAADARAAEVDDLLNTLGVPSSASVRQAAAALREGGHRAENQAIRGAVRVRKMRLDVPLSSPLTGVPGTPPAHPGTPRGSVPGTPPPLGGARHTSSGVPETARHTPTEGAVTDDTLVGCRSCFSPHLYRVTRTLDGLCPNCHRATGQIA